VLGSSGCNIVVLNAHPTTDGKSDDLRAGSMSNYCTYSVTFLRHMKIMLGDFNEELGRENIFKPTTGNESLYESYNENSVRFVNFATLKI
jgi:hypothetical protein